ncbi:cytochrome b termination protein 1 [Monosporozyma servazzii]
MSAIIPKFVQKYGHPLGKKGIAELESKISRNIILNKYREYLQFNNVMYLFQWELNEDVSYLNKNQAWETFSEKLVGKYQHSRDLDGQNNFSINTSPLKPSIYSDIMAEALVSSNSLQWLPQNKEDKDVRCIFQEVNPQKLLDIVDYLNKISTSLTRHGQRVDMYKLNLSHLCIKVSGLNGMDLGESIPNPATNEPLDYEGLLRLAAQSKEDPPLKILLQLLIKDYHLSKPALTRCDKDHWLVLSH